jgi:AGZA family xanthine/uracil permease-like MFS transporter
VLRRLFRPDERDATVGGEIRGGLVTFVTMAYIVVLNPLILGSVDPTASSAKRDVLGATLSVPQVAAVTALVAGVMTILFGLVANFPFALATGLGINTLVAVTLAPQMTWPEAMGLVVVEGLIIVVLGLTGFRTAVFAAIPDQLKIAISAGIGAFIALIGLVDAGFVRRIPDAANTTVPVGLGINGSIASWPTAVFCVGLLITGVLVARGTRAGILIGVVVTTVIAVVVEAIVHAGPSNGTDPHGWDLGYPGLPSSIVSLPDLSLVGDVSFGAFTRLPAIAVTLLVFTLVFANFFDAMGTFTGLAREADLADEQGTFPRLRSALIVEGAGAVVGGAASASSSTVFIESGAGIGEGARTGLANLVTGGLFLAAMFVAPLASIVPTEVAAAALVIVGVMMASQLRHIELDEFSVAMPVILTVVVMPFSYSIANGIGVGFIAWVVLRSAVGKAREINPLLWIVAVGFGIYFARGWIESLIGV